MKEVKVGRPNLTITVPWPSAARQIREREAEGYELVKRESSNGQVTLEFEDGTSEGDPSELPE